MHVSRSLNQSVEELAESLGYVAKALQILAGSLEELESRVEHIEGLLKDIEEDIETESGPSEEVREYVSSILPCGTKEDRMDLDRWYSEGGYFLG